MKSHVSFFFLFLLLAVFPAFHADASQSTDADAPASVKVHSLPVCKWCAPVDGRQLTDEHGNAVQLKRHQHPRSCLVPGLCQSKKLFISFVRNGM